MVRVLGGTVAFQGAPPVAVEDFWIDRFEVTNGDFQRFVDAGGYERPEYWRHPVIDNGTPLALADAMRRFKDATGRAGPVTWALGRFPEGARELPVGGVSWYEAAAYAEWAGKSLPTYYHWYRAAVPDVFADIVRASRFGGDGPAAVGSLTGLGPWGTLDMAGNVKEWAWSATGPMRYALGAAWNDPAYLFAEPEAFPPVRREADTGFRCIKIDRPLIEAVLAPVVRQERDLSRERPVSDEVFRALASVYSYDRSLPLDARLEAADDAQVDWRVERVSIAAAYGGERLPILLYLPKPAKPPYSVVVYFPDSTAETATPTEAMQRRWFDFLVRAGRAVAVPVFKNMYERHTPRTGPWTPTWRRDLVIAWSRDVGRTLDYLSTRPDVDSNRVALHGFSLGAIYGPIVAALEPRLKAMILLGGGLSAAPLPPEADPFQFASRVRAATLMIAGREDFVRPVEKAQRPLFDQLGVPADRKRLAILEGGHMPPSLNAVVREMLDWLDRFLGPV
jgi:dienelactone hydrolase